MSHVSQMERTARMDSRIAARVQNVRNEWIRGKYAVGFNMLEIKGGCARFPNLRWAEINDALWPIWMRAKLDREGEAL